MTHPERADTVERRSSRYAFPNMGALKAYFSRLLPQGDIEARVEEAIRGFRVRAGVSEAETRLQLVKKCEESLFKGLMEAPPGGNPAERA